MNRLYQYSKRRVTLKILYRVKHLVGEVRDRPAPVRLDRLAALDERVVVTSPGNLVAAVVDDRKDGEASGVVAGGDGEVTTLDGATLAAGGRGALNDILALSGLNSVLVGVDGEVPGALGVLLVAFAVEVLKGPLRLVSGKHRLDSPSSRGSNGRGGEESGEDGLGELHFVGVGK